MEAIADGAGVAVGTLYRHYPTKADLVEAVIEDSVADLAHLALATDTAIAAGGDPEAEVASLLRSIAGRGSENRALRAAALSLGVPNPLRPTENPPTPGSPDERRARRPGPRDRRRTHGWRPPRYATRLDIAVLLRGVLDIQLDDRSRDRYVEIILAGLRPPRADG